MASSFIHPFKPYAFLKAYFNGPFGQFTCVFFVLQRTEHDCEANISRSEEANVGDGESPVLLDGEDHADYDRLVAAAKKGVAPRDELEQLWVEDVVYLVWEARRLRRLKAHLLKSSARHGLKEVLELLVRDLSNTDPIVVL